MNVLYVGELTLVIIDQYHCKENHSDGVDQRRNDRERESDNNSCQCKFNLAIVLVEMACGNY